MEKINVLIFPAGAENALEIYESIRNNVNIEVFGASGKPDHAEYVYAKDHYFEGDYYIDDPDFKMEFCSLLKRLSIDVLIPTHDTIALYFARNMKDFPVRILTADLKTAEVCREKKKTYQMFGEYSFCPKIYNELSDIMANYPLFAKPNIGEGAKGASIIKSLNDLQYCIDSYKKEFIVMEYLPGEEFTIDCFTDADGRLRYCGMRTRSRIQMGIAFRSKTVQLPDEVKNIAEVINSKLNFLGGWFFQVKKDIDGQYKLLEISCRMAGTMTLHRHQGINFSLLGIFEIMGFHTDYVEIPYDLEVDRCLKGNFKLNYQYDSIYIDYDDTITGPNGSVNVDVLKLLYQAKNNKKKIVLLTRHEGDLEQDMQQKCIHSSLFDHIIHITFDDEKATYISPERAIFIDNSFAERKKVSDKYHIPVLDVDAVDMLFDQ